MKQKKLLKIRSLPLKNAACASYEINYVTYIYLYIFLRQVVSLNLGPSEFNFSDHFCLQNDRMEASFFSLDSEPASIFIYKIYLVKIP